MSVYAKFHAALDRKCYRAIFDPSPWLWDDLIAEILFAILPVPRQYTSKKGREMNR